MFEDWWSEHQTPSSSDNSNYYTSSSSSNGNNNSHSRSNPPSRLSTHNLAPINLLYRHLAVRCDDINLECTILVIGKGNEFKLNRILGSDIYCIVLYLFWKADGGSGWWMEHRGVGEW